MPAQDDHPLAALFPWVLERLDRPLTVEDLARQARTTVHRHVRMARRAAAWHETHPPA